MGYVLLSSILEKILLSLGGRAEQDRFWGIPGGAVAPGMPGGPLGIPGGARDRFWSRTNILNSYFDLGFYQPGPASRADCRWVLASRRCI